MFKKYSKSYVLNFSKTPICFIKLVFKLKKVLYLKAI